MLKLGFTLEMAAVPVPRKERLDPELVSRMPSGKRFRIVVEGTEEFTQLMQELTAHTIWEEDLQDAHADPKNRWLRPPEGVPLPRPDTRGFRSPPQVQLKGGARGRPPLHLSGPPPFRGSARATRRPPASGHRRSRQARTADESRSRSDRASDWGSASPIRPPRPCP